MKILAVDDKPINNKVIELDTQEYFKSIGKEDCTFIEKSNAKDALTIIIEDQIDIVFMDIVMPITDGIEAVKQIKSYGDDIKQPMIIMVTTLNDKDTKQQAKDIGANSYISKPYCYREIFASIKFCMDELSKEIEIDIEDDFLDFDDFDDEDNSFFDFDDEDDTINVQKEMLDDFNKSHKQVSAEEFLKEYQDLGYILEDLENIEHDILDQIDTLYEGNLANEISTIVVSIEQYSRFLNGFLEFQELSTALHLLTKILENSNFNTIDSKHNYLIAEFIKAMLVDLLKWKEHVFIVQDAIDVYYINASLLSTCIQLEDILKNIK